MAQGSNFIITKNIKAFRCSSRDVWGSESQQRASKFERVLTAGSSTTCQTQTRARSEATPLHKRVAYKMADPPQSSHPSRCPQPPSQASGDREIKIEHKVDSPSEGEQHQSTQGGFDFKELLNGIAKQNQQLADMQRLQLEDKPQTDATNHAAHQASKRSGPILQSSLVYSNQQLAPLQMKAPWTFGGMPYMPMSLMNLGPAYLGMPGLGQFLPYPWAPIQPLGPFNSQQIFPNILGQYFGANLGPGTFHGFTRPQSQVPTGGRRLQSQNSVQKSIPGYVQDAMPTIQNSPMVLRGRESIHSATLSRGNPLALRRRGDTQQEELSHRSAHTVLRGRGNKPVTGPSRGNLAASRGRGNLLQNSSFIRDSPSRVRGRGGSQKPSLHTIDPPRQGRASTQKHVQDKEIWQPDPSEPCCQCGSYVHQLKYHPNPNTPQGYLRGCFHCNKLSHSFSKCPYRHDLKKLKWYYLRTCRTGLCPAEDFRDFREIPKLNDDGMGQYSVEMYLPLTPQFALNHPYPDERNFRHPLEGGDFVLFEDPFWESEDPLADLGCFGVKGFSSDDLEQALWTNLTRHRRSVLQKQVEERAKAYIEDEVSPDGLGMVPMNNLHSTRGTKSDRSSTPPPHQTYSIENPVRPSSHKNLPTRAPRGHDRSSPESAITRQANSSKIFRPRKGQEPSQANHMKRSRQRSPSPSPSESAFSDLSTTAVTGRQPLIERPVKKRRRGGDESIPKRNDARSGSRNHDRALSESTRSREESLRVRGYRPGNSLQERTYACRACGTRRDSSPGCYLCR